MYSEPDPPTAARMRQAHARAAHALAAEPNAPGEFWGLERPDAEPVRCHQRVRPVLAQAQAGICAHRQGRREALGRTPGRRVPDPALSSPSPAPPAAGLGRRHTRLPRRALRSRHSPHHHNRQPCAAGGSPAGLTLVGRSRPIPHHDCHGPHPARSRTPGIPAPGYARVPGHVHRQHGPGVVHRAWRPALGQRGFGLRSGLVHHHKVVSETHHYAVLPFHPCPVEPVQVDVAERGAHAPPSHRRPLAHPL